MGISDQVQNIIAEIGTGTPKMGDVKKLAKSIGKNHELAMALWSEGSFNARLVSVLAMDKKEITEDLIEAMAEDMTQHDDAQRDRLSEWFMANQLMKSKHTSEMLKTWQNHSSPVLRRLFWYHQARLRWTGQVPPDNTSELVEAIEAGLGDEVPQVQWAMNFAAGQIGVHDAKFRDRLVKFGKDLGLYSEEKAPKGCTPNYLPEFIRIEVAKRA